VTGPAIRRESYLLVFAMLFVVGPTNILTPLLPEIRDDLHVSIIDAGWVVGSFGLARLAFDLPAGLLIDWFGHRWLTVAALAVLALSSLVGLNAGGLEVLIAARIGSGLAVATLLTVILAALAATAHPANRGRVMSLFPTFQNAATALYPLVGAGLGVALGWRSTFGLTAVLAAAATFLLVPVVFRIELPRRGGRPAAAPPDPRVLHGRRRTIAVGTTLAGVVAGMVHRHGFRNTVLPLYAAAALGLGAIPIAAAVAAMSLAALAATVVGGPLSDRIGRRRVIVAGLAAVGIADLVFLLSGDLVTFLLGAALIGACDFAVSSQTALLSEIVPPDLRTRVLSAYRFSGDVGVFLGPITLAAVMDLANAQAAIALAAALLLAASLAARLGIPPGVDRTAG
jgi:MFS family permease